MARLFGTDGVRGVANEELTPLLAMQLGQAAGCAAALAHRSGKSFPDLKPVELIALLEAGGVRLTSLPGR